MKALKSVLYYLLIIGLLLYIGVLLISPDKMTEVLGFRTFFVMTNSMEPVINVQDLVVVRPVDEDELEVGDIITFKVYIAEIGREEFVTHYIADEQNTDEGIVYLTQGAHMAEGIYDEWTDAQGNSISLQYEDIEGEYLFRIPYLGYVKNAMTDPFLLGLIVVNGVLIYLLVGYIKKSKITF